MNRSLLALAISVALASASWGFTVVEPGVQANGAPEIVTPDENVRSLGQVHFALDFAATRDSLYELKIRRHSLTLPDGRPVTALAYDKDANVLVGGTDPVTHISLAAVNETVGGREAMALFHNGKSEVIAPESKDIAVFDLSFNPISFDYKPVGQPRDTKIPVSILIDRSGSMSRVMPEVLDATRAFMKTLPEFTRCELLTFAKAIERLTPSAITHQLSCPRSTAYLPGKLKTGGATALYEALHQSFQAGQNQSTTPKIVVVLTDGVNTATSHHSKASLLKEKNHAPAKLFVFWAGEDDPKHLDQLSDWEVMAGEDVRTQLDRFFQSIGISVSGIQTLRLHTAGLSKP
ncbi:MAG: VWA domain-containing protein [Rhodospirillales bacterium]|nr:VWA domain-containing protein [Rhodospirillales bacterium]